MNCPRCKNPMRPSDNPKGPWYCIPCHTHFGAHSPKPVADTMISRHGVRGHSIKSHGHGGHRHGDAGTFEDVLGGKGLGK